MSVIKPILHDRRANCWLLPLYRKGYPQKQFTVNIMVNPSTHIMRCNKLIIFVGSYKKKVYRKRKHGGSTLNESQVNERNCCKSESYYTAHTNRGFSLPILSAQIIWTDFEIWLFSLTNDCKNWPLKKEIMSIQKNKNWSHSHFWRA